MLFNCYKAATIISSNVLRFLNRNKHNITINNKNKKIFFKIMLRLLIILPCYLNSNIISKKYCNENKNMCILYAIQSNILPAI